MNLVKSTETDRCTLNLLDFEDVEEGIELFTDSEARKYLGGTISKEEAKIKLNSWANEKKRGLLWSVYYSVRLKEGGHLIGIISITPYHNLLYKELSYQFLPRFWGNGYAYEAIKMVIKQCKIDYKLKYLVSETQTANTKSCRLLEKLGYRLKKKLERFGSEQAVYIIKLC